MDYINNLKNMCNRRIIQLENEKKLDYSLLNSYKHCPVTVFTYLLKSRELNRKYSYDMYSSSIFKYIEKAQKNIDIVDKLYQQYYTECPYKLCENLSSIIIELETQLKS